MKNIKKTNVLNFPNNLTQIEREVEAIIFAAAEPLDVDTIESKVSKKTDVKKIFNKPFTNPIQYSQKNFLKLQP